MVEFLVVGVVMAVPIAVAAATLVGIHQRQALAQRAAAQAALVLARTGGGAPRAAVVVDGLWNGPPAITTVVCRPGCGAPGATITVRVSAEIMVPLLPVRVPVRAEQSQVVDRFATRG